MRPIVFTYSLDTADADGICQSQTKVGAGALTINGALSSGGVATMDEQRRVLITSAGNDSGITFTVVGTDTNGRAISESITGANIGTSASTLDFKTVTSVTVSGSTAAAVTVGTNGVGAGKPLPLNWNSLGGVALQVVVSGTVDYTVQQTLDNVYEDATPTWFDHPDTNLVTNNANVQGNYEFIPFATRIQINSGTGEVTFTIIQAGSEL